MRFPGKPLVDLAGRPLVQWVHDATVEAALFDHVCVATDDERIAECVASFGGDVEMTRDDHRTGTDRVAEVAARHPEHDVVVNVQGDQPFVTSAMLSALIAPYDEGRRPAMTTLGCPLTDEQIDDPNSVKVLLDQRRQALYFSRAPVPHRRADVTTPTYHHLGLYGFAAEFLAEYARLVPTPFEESEGLEQLRVLEHGHTIEVGLVGRPIIEVNTPADLDAAHRHVAALGGAPS